MLRGKYERGEFPSVNQLQYLMDSVILCCLSASVPPVFPAVFLSVGILSHKSFILLSYMLVSKYCDLLARIVITDDNITPTKIKNPDTSPDKIEDIKKKATTMNGKMRYIVNEMWRASSIIVGLPDIIYNV